MQRRLTGLALLALIALATGAAWAGKSAWVIPEALSVRKSPSTQADRIATLTKGQKVTVTAFREDGWCKVLNGMTTVEEIVRVTKTDASAVV